MRESAGRPSSSVLWEMPPGPPCTHDPKEAPMRHALVPSVLALLAVAAPAQPRKAEPPAVVELLEDGVESLLRQMRNDGVEQLANGTPDFRDFYSGVCSVRVAP